MTNQVPKPHPFMSEDLCDAIAQVHQVHSLVCCTSSRYNLTSQSVRLDLEYLWLHKEDNSNEVFRWALAYAKVYLNNKGLPAYMSLGILCSDLQGLVWICE